jgi:hypothetical protein
MEQHSRAPNQSASGNRSTVLPAYRALPHIANFPLPSCPRFSVSFLFNFQHPPSTYHDSRVVDLRHPRSKYWAFNTMSVSPQLDVHLSSEFSSSDPRPLFLTTSQISGTVHISNLFDSPPDAIKIILQGYQSLRIFALHIDLSSVAGSLLNSLIQTATPNVDGYQLTLAQTVSSKYSFDQTTFSHF